MITEELCLLYFPITSTKKKKILVPGPICNLTFYLAFLLTEEKFSWFVLSTETGYFSEKQMPRFYLVQISCK